MANIIVNPPTQSSSPPDVNDKNSTGNIIAAGIGTALILLANNISEPSFLKSWLINCAPTVSVFSAWLWRTFTKLYTKTKKYVKGKKAEWNLRNEVNVALKDPHITNEKKEKIKQEQSELQLERIDMLTRKVRAIRSEE